MIKFSKSVILGLAFLLVFSIFFASNSFAEEENSSDDDSANVTSSVSPTKNPARGELSRERLKEAREKKAEIKDRIEARISEAAAKKEERLSEARLKICKVRSKNIENRLSAMQKRAKVIHQGHEKIYQRVDEFYTNKLVPNGYVLSNYADLKAEIAANKENVALLLESAQTSGKDFDCESDDPKGQVDAFQEDMKALIDANKKYKDSIHAFVKAVRDLAKTAKLDKVSLTPSQSPTPTVEVVQ